MQKKYQNSNVISGEVLFVGETRTAGTSFTVREVVIKSGNDQHPKGLPVEFVKDDIALIDEVTAGDHVEIEYFLEGSPDKGTGKFYPHLRGKQIVVTARATGSATPTPGGMGCTMETAIAEWTKHHGDDKKGFAEFCQKARPDIVQQAQQAGVKFCTFAANRLDVWADITNKIAAAVHNPGYKTPEDVSDDDMPF